MKLIYSPYYDGSAYIDFSDKKCLMGVKVVNNMGLLEELELRAGISHTFVETESTETYGKETEMTEDENEKRKEEREEKRIKAYAEALRTDGLKGTGEITDRELNIAKELLRWRDELIYAGWNRSDKLGIGKLDTYIVATEKKANKTIYGMADRWLRLSTKKIVLKEISLEINCPKQLIKPLIAQVLENTFGSTIWKYEEESGVEYRSKYEILNANELHEAYEWLSTQTLDWKSVVICKDKKQLSNVLYAFDKPEVAKAQVGSFCCINDIKDIVDSPDRIIWIGCNGGYDYIYPYNFLSTADQEKLKSEGLTIINEEEMFVAVRKYTAKMLNKAKEVTLVTSKYKYNELQTEHPIVSELQNREKDKTEGKDIVINYPTKESKIIKFSNRVYFENSGDMDIKRIVQSYTSLSNLFQSPFDYVMEKELGLYDPNYEERMDTVKGLVAHKVFELMVGECDQNLAKLKKLYEERYEEFFDQAINYEKDDKHCGDKYKLGAMLLKEENLLEQKELKNSLKKSFDILINILEQTGLKPIACEVDLNRENMDELKRELGMKELKDEFELEGIGEAKAQIDFLLSDDKGRYVIIDFKNSSSNHYPDLLKENKSIQFEIYRQLLSQVTGKDKESIICAYYLFTNKRLYTTKSDYFKPDENVSIVAVASDLVLEKAIRNSYEYRMNEIKNGKIEEGEGMPLEESDYYRSYADDMEELYPLTTSYSPQTNKSEGYSKKHIVLKEQNK